MTRKPRQWSEMTPLQLAQARAPEWVCTTCGLSAEVYTDLPGGHPYVRCPQGADHVLERRRYVEDRGLLAYRAETEERKQAERRPVADLLPQTDEEWERARDAFFG